MTKIRTSLVICAKNEAKTLAKVISQPRKYVDEVLVIDGHSTDGSRALAQKLGVCVYLDNGKGKGAAIRLGIAHAKGKVLVFMDADGSHDPQDIGKLIRPIAQGKADIVVASRGKGGSDELHGDVEKTVRLVGSALITLCINLRFRTDLTDSQNGFRSIRRSVALKLKLCEDIFTIEQEMVIKALKQGYQVSEIASHEYKRQSGRSRIKLVAMGPRYIWCLLKNIL